MHEMTIARSILDIAIEAAQKGGATRISRVNVLAGELRAIEPLHLAFCFTIMAEGTMADAAQLNVEIVPVRGTCRLCGTAFSVQNHEYVCPACHSPDIQTEGGTELRLTDIEVD